MAMDFMELQPTQVACRTYLSHRSRVDAANSGARTTEALRESNARFLTLWGADDRIVTAAFASMLHISCPTS